MALSSLQSSSKLRRNSRLGINDDDDPYNGTQQRPGGGQAPMVPPSSLTTGQGQAQVMPGMPGQDLAAQLQQGAYGVGGGDPLAEAAEANVHTNTQGSAPDVNYAHLAPGSDIPDTRMNSFSPQNPVGGQKLAALRAKLDQGLMPVATAQMPEANPYSKLPRSTTMNNPDGFSDYQPGQGQPKVELPPSVQLPTDQPAPVLPSAQHTGFDEYTGKNAQAVRGEIRSNENAGAGYMKIAGQDPVAWVDKPSGSINAPGVEAAAGGVSPDMNDPEDVLAFTQAQQRAHAGVQRAQQGLGAADQDVAQVGRLEEELGGRMSALRKRKAMVETRLTQIDKQLSSVMRPVGSTNQRQWQGSRLLAERERDGLLKQQQEIEGGLAETEGTLSGLSSTVRPSLENVKQAAQSDLQFQQQQAPQQIAGEVGAGRVVRKQKREQQKMRVESHMNTLLNGELNRDLAQDRNERGQAAEDRQQRNQQQDQVIQERGADRADKQLGLSERAANRGDAQLGLSQTREQRAAGEQQYQHGQDAQRNAERRIKAITAAKASANSVFNAETHDADGGLLPEAAAKMQQWDQEIAQLQKQANALVSNAPTAATAATATSAPSAPSTDPQKSSRLSFFKQEFPEYSDAQIEQLYAQFIEEE